MKSTLLTRMPIVLVGIPLIIYLLNEGGMIFSSFVALITFLCLIEFYGLKRKSGARPNGMIGVFMALTICFMYIQFPNANATQCQCREYINKSVNIHSPWLVYRNV